MEDRLMTLDEVAEYLQVDITTVYIYIRAKADPLPCYRLSRRTVRVRLNELEDWITMYSEKGGEE